jgi:MFS family permease
MTNILTSAGRGRGPVITLIAACLAGGTLPASLSGSSIALPSIGTHFGASLTSLQWVVNAYNLTFASFMLACGALADLVGRRRMFAGGALLFALASLASALAPGVLWLDLCRALSGIGAAAVLTSVSAMLAASFEGPALGAAFGLLGSAFGAGLAFGPALAGLLVGQWGWRAVFAAHAVLVAVALTALPAMRESRDPGASRVDWAGTATFTGALFCLTLGLLEGPQHGWASAPALPLLVGFLVLMVGFALAEHVQERPMFDLGLLRKPRFVGVCLTPVVLAFSFVALLVLLPSYLTAADGLSAPQAGLAMMALTAPVLLLPAFAGMAARRIPVGRLLALSLVLMAAGDAWLTVIHPGMAVVRLVPPLVLVGSGMGVSAGLLDGAAVSSVEPARAGMAAGMFNTMRLAGETVAIVAMTAVLISVTRTHYVAAGFGARAGDLADRAVSGDLDAVRSGLSAGQVARLADGLTDGLRVVLVVIAVLALLAAPLIAGILRTRAASEPSAQAAEPGDAAGVPSDEVSQRAA